MPKFEEFMQNFRQAYSAENFTMDEFVTAATNAYNEDKTVWDAAVTEKETAFTKAQADLTQARADNWKLLMGKGVTPAPGDAVSTMASGHTGDAGDDGKTITIDDFFTAPKKE